MRRPKKVIEYPEWKYYPASFEGSFVLENQKEISRVYVAMNNVSIHNKNTWRETMMFLNNTMEKFEAFFVEYRDIISS